MSASSATFDSRKVNWNVTRHRFPPSAACASRTWMNVLTLSTIARHRAPTMIFSWVSAVAPSPKTPAMSTEPSAPATGTIPAPAVPVATHTIPASAEAEVKGLGQVPPPVAKPTPNPRGPKPAGPQPGEFAPTDPFDPEIFNRQFGSGR